MSRRNSMLVSQVRATVLYASLGFGVVVAAGPVAARQGIDAGSALTAPHAPGVSGDVLDPDVVHHFPPTVVHHFP